LHAHSSLISREIFTLLCNGYASGAEARWRSLYETTVIVFFIAEHDRDVAEKYLLHEKIETYKGMEQYNKYAEKLNGNPFSEKEVKQAKEIKDNLCKNTERALLMIMDGLLQNSKRKNPISAILKKAYVFIIGGLIIKWQVIQFIQVQRV